MCVPDMGGHPHALEEFLQACHTELTSTTPGAPRIVDSLDFPSIINCVITGVGRNDRWHLIRSDIIVGIIIAAVLGDRVSLNMPAHPAHLEWTYSKLNDKGYLVLEETDVDDVFYVRLPFVWLMVYLRQLSGDYLLSAAFRPLREFMEPGGAFWWQEFEEFNCKFLALRINLLMLKYAAISPIVPTPWTLPWTLPWTMPPTITLKKLFNGAVVSLDCADRLVQLPPGFVTTAVISSAFSNQFPTDSHPMDDQGKIIAWERGTVVVQNITGAPQDHFCVLLSPHANNGKASLPYLLNCRSKYTDTGGALTLAEVREEYDKCKESVTASSFNRGNEFQFLFALFANRPATDELKDHLISYPGWKSLLPCSIVVSADEYRSFYGHTFAERAKFAATMMSQYKLYTLRDKCVFTLSLIHLPLVIRNCGYVGVCVCVCVCLFFSFVDESLNVNTVGGTELGMWPGIGAVTAKQILLNRERKYFSDWDDLITKVPQFPNHLRAKVTF